MAARQAPVDSLAAVLCGGDSQRPDWLAAALERGVAVLRFSISADAGDLCRVEVRKRLEAVRAAARSIAAALDDAATMRALGVDAEADGHTFHGVVDLIARADATLSGIRLGGGADKFDPQRSPQEICARLVVTLWRLVRGTQPGHTAAVANEACNMLWQMAGGGSLSDNTNTSRRWLKQIKAANEANEDADIVRALGCTGLSV
jgi:hypothetical protein